MLLATQTPAPFLVQATAPLERARMLERARIENCILKVGFGVCSKGNWFESVWMRSWL